MVKPVRKRKKSQLNLSSLVFFAFIALILGITFFVLLNKNSKFDIRSKAATPVYNRILWQDANWYIHGVNLPWYNWACDFGCNDMISRSGGVSTNLTVLDEGFKRAKNQGSNVVRWWVFPGDPWQITRDGSNTPTGINSATYKDFDAALTLADKYDIYYNFVLFSSPASVPLSWQTDAVKREKLSNVLGTLFQKYKSHPRIISWEIYNEPESDIWNNQISEAAVVETGKLIAQSVHTNSPGTLVTVGSLFADGMKMWLNAGLDYYSPHWYDYMSGGDYCMLCNDYNHYASWGVNKPIVVGEFYTGTATTTPNTSSVRYEYWYNNGYAGAWAWSLFPDRTNDKMVIDEAASANFAASHNDIGPRSTISTMSPTPTPTIQPANTSTPIPTAATSDLINPSVNIIFPTDGAVLRRSSTISISASASDNIKVAKVEFYVNGKLTCSDVSADYSCRWRVPGKRNSSYTLLAKAFDTTGNTAQSSVRISVR